MEPIRITYRTHENEKTFTSDFGEALAPSQVDSLVLEAVIQHEFPENMALRRIVDFPLGETAQKETIEAVMRRLSFHHIEYQIGEQSRKIQAKHLFHL